MPAHEHLVEVHLLDVPLRLRARYIEHGRDLLRELALVRVGGGRPGSRDLPTRLIDLAEELDTTYAVFANDPGAELAAALARGQDTADATYRVPAHAADFVRRLSEALEEADEYCRAGHYLLTPPADDDAAAYRRWVLGEFVAQIGGAAPQPWTSANLVADCEGAGRAADH